MVWGKCIPAERSLALGTLPIGLAHGVRLKRAIRQGEMVGWADVAYDAESEPVRIRRAMEAAAPAQATE
jgi:predicted homoserine dehydrogenase-like protein